MKHDVEEMVVGFLFTTICDILCVVLIEKQRPEWQKGKLNGVGGHMEKGESPLKTMTREFEEEAGITVDDWHVDIIMKSDLWRVYFFSTFAPYEIVKNVESKTDEEIIIIPVEKIHEYPVISNLKWIVPFCCYSQEYVTPINIFLP